MPCYIHTSESMYARDRVTFLERYHAKSDALLAKLRLLKSTIEVMPQTPDPVSSEDFIESRNRQARMTSLLSMLQRIAIDAKVYTSLQKGDVEFNFDKLRLERDIFKHRSAQQSVEFDSAVERVQALRNNIADTLGSIPQTGVKRRRMDNE